MFVYLFENNLNWIPSLLIKWKQLKRNRSFKNREYQLIYYSYIKFSLPRSNRQGRKRPFTEINGAKRRSCTVSVHDQRIRRRTIGYGFRIRRSWKKLEVWKGNIRYSVYGDKRLSFTTVYHRRRSYTIVAHIQ